jgi:hypothetical protein
LRHTYFADVQFGDLAAVTKSGEVYRINPDKLGGAVVPENLPGVVQAREAFKADQERSDALYAQRRAENAVARQAFAEAREKRTAVADRGKPVSAEKVASKGVGVGAKVLGAVTVGLFRFLDGLFSAPKRITAEEAKNNARAADERREIAAERAAIRENETRRGEQIARQDEEQSQHLSAPGYFRTVTRPADPAERRRQEQERGHERERER